MLQLVRDSLGRQFAATLDTLTKQVAACSDDLWDARDAGPPFWLVCFHACFYLDFYLRDNEESFEPRSYHRPGLHDLAKPPATALTKADLEDYLAWLRGYVAGRLAGWSEADLAAPSPFPWMPMGRFESLVYNARHLQHHIAELNVRLKSAGLEPVRWIGIGTLV